jgi:hypothetical protein
LDGTVSLWDTAVRNDRAQLQGNMTPYGAPPPLAPRGCAAIDLVLFGPFLVWVASARFFATFPFTASAFVLWGEYGVD